MRRTILCDDSTRILTTNQTNHYDLVIKKTSCITFEKPGFTPKPRAEKLKRNFQVYHLAVFNMPTVL
jgi:hypothetical protein